MKNKNVRGCDWCGMPIIGEPYKVAGGKCGQWEKTYMHTECRRKEKNAYK